MPTVPFQFDAFTESELKELNESELKERIGSGGSVYIDDVLQLFDRRQAWLPRYGDYLGYGDFAESDIPAGHKLDADGVTRLFLHRVTVDEYVTGGSTYYKRRTTRDTTRYEGNLTETIETLVGSGSPPVLGSFNYTFSSTNGTGTYEHVSVIDYYNDGVTRTITVTYTLEQVCADIWDEVLALFDSATWESANASMSIVTKNDDGDVVAGSSWATGAYANPRAGGEFIVHGDGGTFVAYGRRYKVVLDDWYLEQWNSNILGEHVSTTNTVQDPKLDAQPFILEILPSGFTSTMPVIGTPP